MTTPTLEEFLKQADAWLAERYPPATDTAARRFVALTTLGHERNAMGHSAFGGAGILSTERLIGLVHAMGKQADPVIRQEFGELLSHLRTARYTQEVMAAQARAGERRAPRLP